jgi:hypothetical protein
MVSILEEAVQIGEFKIAWQHDQILEPIRGICLVKRNIIDTEDFANIGGKNCAV